MKAWLAFRKNLWLLVPGGYLFQAERRKKIRDERREKILETSSPVKKFIRFDGRERITIFQCPGETFGAVLESMHGKAGWRSDSLIGPGAVFDSVEAVESQVLETIRSLRWKNV
ncbi:MAG TPA: hypothetical protein VHD62_06795 [Opitutaceae bacterium]|nr:hypothetical protein [Opitutaceae bacterium]